MPNNRVFIALFVAALTVCHAHAQEPLSDTTWVVITVESHPVGAAVFVDSVYLGKSPFAFTASNSAPHLIQFTLEDYVTLTRRIRKGARDTLAISVTMVPNWSIVNVSASPRWTQLLIDNHTAAGADTGLFRLECGRHTMRFQDTASGRWTERTLIFTPGDSMAVRGTLGARSMSPVLLSLLVPGWGQMYDRSPLPAAAFFAGFVGTGIMAIHYRGAYERARDDYQNTYALYQVAPTEQGALELRSLVNSRRDDANSLARTANVWTVLTAAVYIANVADALLNHAIDDYVDISAGKMSGGTSPPRFSDAHDFRVNFAIHF